jgi:hypothetical protein
MLQVCAAIVKEVLLRNTWGLWGIILAPSLWSRQLITHRKQTMKIGTQIINIQIYFVIITVSKPAITNVAIMRNFGVISDKFDTHNLFWRIGNIATLK